jgi:DNA helicase-2/ATP-dependent DNA helicase PcrA
MYVQCHGCFRLFVPGRPNQLRLQDCMPPARLASSPLRNATATTRQLCRVRRTASWDGTRHAPLLRRSMSGARVPPPERVSSARGYRCRCGSTPPTCYCQPAHHDPDCIERVTGSHFSAAQLQAITAADGPVAIVAGPGCGKTTVLAGRIAYLINERGFDPSSILVVSFTTEAARRLRREVANQLGDRAADVAIHTLHALGRRVIDTWAIKLGYEDRPSVLHRDEARGLLASAATGLGWDVAAIPINEVASAVDRCRLQVDSEARQADPLAPLAAAYEERLRRHGVIDFVAMLSLPLRLFTEDSAALRVLQDAYYWVMADEVQDLDPTQWRLVELLAARHGNLLVAGDDAQCLFRWRGADPRALERFADRYPSASVVTLDKNLRSTSNLVLLGNALGDLLTNRTTLWTDNPPGPIPRLFIAEDEHAEAAFVAQQIGTCQPW